MNILFDTSSLISNVFSSDIEKSTTNFTNIFANNGKFQMIRTPLMTTILKNDAILTTLPDIEESFTLNIPKIPFEIFELMGAFFRKVYKKSKTESSIMVFYNKEEDYFTTWVPSQTNTGTTSNYQRHDDPEYVKMCEENILVMVAHSHPWASSSAPGPSGTDNNDEKESLLYIIYSNVEKIPTYTISTCPNAKRTFLKFESVFEMPETNLTREDKIVLLKAQDPKISNNKIMDVFFKAASDEEINEFFEDNILSSTIINMSYNPNEEEIPEEWMARCIVKTYNATYTNGYNINTNRGTYWNKDNVTPQTAPADPYENAYKNLGISDDEYDKYIENYYNGMA